MAPSALRRRTSASLPMPGVSELATSSPLPSMLRMMACICFSSRFHNGSSMATASWSALTDRL